jgi:hypothetical protein
MKAGDYVMLHGGERVWMIEDVSSATGLFWLGDGRQQYSKPVTLGIFWHVMPRPPIYPFRTSVRTVWDDQDWVVADIFFKDNCYSYGLSADKARLYLVIEEERVYVPCKCTT